MGDEQRQFLDGFERFVDSGFSPAEFSDEVYRRLVSAFGFPLCGGRQGFHYYWFEFPRLDEFARRIGSAESGDGWSTVRQAVTVKLGRVGTCDQGRDKYSPSAEARGMVS